MPDEPIRKRIEFDRATWHALDLLARDSMKTVQDLVDEAIADLLKKKGRPSNLKDALTLSSRRLPANDAAPSKRR